MNTFLVPPDQLDIFLETWIERPRAISAWRFMDGDPDAVLPFTIRDDNEPVRLSTYFLTAISFLTTNQLRRCIAATQMQKLPSFSLTGASRRTSWTIRD
jgi:hypothetical protein